MKQPKATITITDDGENVDLNLTFSPPLNQNDSAKNPNCYYTALKMMQVYAEHREKEDNKIA